MGVQLVQNGVEDSVFLGRQRLHDEFGVVREEEKGATFAGSLSRVEDLPPVHADIEGIPDLCMVDAIAESYSMEERH